MRVVFIGGVTFSRVLLQELAACQVEIVGIIGRETLRAGTDQVSLAPLACEMGIPYLATNDSRMHSVATWIRGTKPDIGMCFGWSQLLSSELLSIPRLGFIGYHPALLPQNRGRHPIIWALALGLTKTGSTFFRLDEQADTGAIVDQEEVDILYDDTAQNLYDRLQQSASKQLHRICTGLSGGELNVRAQAPHHGNSWRKRGRPDGIIDFRMSSRTIYNLVRALAHPYCGATVIYEGKEHTVWSVSETKDFGEANDEPGKILGLDSTRRPIVKAGEGSVIILNSTLPAPLPANSYLR